MPTFAVFYGPNRASYGGDLIPDATYGQTLQYPATQPGPYNGHVEVSFSRGRIYLDDGNDRGYTIGTLPHSGFRIVSAKLYSGMEHANLDLSSAPATVEITLTPLVPYTLFDTGSLTYTTYIEVTLPISLISIIGINILIGDAVRALYTPPPNYPPPGGFSVLGVLKPNSFQGDVDPDGNPFSGNIIEYFYDRPGEWYITGGGVGPVIVGEYELWSTQFSIDTLDADEGDNITITDGEEKLLEFSSFEVYYRVTPNSNPGYETGIVNVVAPIVSQTAGQVIITLPVMPGIIDGKIGIIGILATPVESVEVFIGAYTPSIPPPPQPSALPADVSGVYTIVPGKTNDTIYNRDMTDSVDVKIPNPTVKTGFVG